MNRDLKNVLNTALSIDELIEQLEKIRTLMPDGGETKVVFKYDSGDHWQTTIAKGVACCDTDYVSYSNYHHALEEAIEDEDEPLEDDEDSSLVVTLSAL